jgi:glucose/arabinose dehydrogenase
MWSSSRLSGGKVSGPFVVFADGFAGAIKTPGAAADRPTGLAMGPDGSLYIADDRAAGSRASLSPAITRVALRRPAPAPSHAGYGFAEGLAAGGRQSRTT